MAIGLRLVLGACCVMLLTIGATWAALGQQEAPPAAESTEPSPAPASPAPSPPSPPSSGATPKSPLIKALYDALDTIEDKENQLGDRESLKKSLREADTTLDRIRRENRRALSGVNRQTPLGNQPNILVVVVDDLPLEHLGCYGQTAIKTPNIDRLAAGGARFTQFRAGPGGANARWTLFTGRPAPATGPLALRPGDASMVHALWRAGYATALFGDYVLGDGHPVLNPADLGFDTWFGSHDPALAFFPQQLTLDGAAVEIAENGGGKQGRFVNDLYTERASRWIRQLSTSSRGRRPFFAMVSYRVPGQNWQAPVLDQYAQQNWSPSAKSWASMVTGVDQGVGSLLDTLREVRALSNTVIIVTADQRRPAAEGDEAFRVEGAQADDPAAGVRLPLIVYGPGRVAALVGDQPASIADLAPTLTGFANFSKGSLPFAGEKLDEQFKAPPVEPKVTGPAEKPTGSEPTPPAPKKKLPQIIRGRP